MIDVRRFAVLVIGAGPRLGALLPAGAAGYWGYATVLSAAGVVDALVPGRVVLVAVVVLLAEAAADLDLPTAR